MNHIDEKLGLYQIFLKLYEQNRGLLDEILNLEIAGDSGLATWSENHVIAVIEPSQTYLITNLGCGVMQKFLQSEGIWTIGRGQDLVLSIPDEHLSRHHAAIQYLPTEGFYLYDLNSTNGTFVNHEWVQDRVLLREGDHVRLGSLVFSFFVCREEKQLPVVPSDVARMLEQRRIIHKTAHSDRIPKGKIKDEPTNPLFDPSDMMGWDDYLPPTAPGGLTPEQQAQLLDRFYHEEDEGKTFTEE
ncbi:FHA domain-containing protein [Spirulina subsalsa FACHB-351]|uniref:FHA domain-containing protein n=1 Tax=Spirulina subsalsa FACHB-351 TaxID=234711 RepID=A0ABT3LA89_9CYAN|nr:FHA domain-containing protein [Spirulina subsalsa]MCW6038403.1 FHA domain-containing protein [Spirulina subsalsa FACHB-351]